MSALEFGDLGHPLAFAWEGGAFLCLSVFTHTFSLSVQPLRLRRGVRRRSEMRRHTEGPAGPGLGRCLTRASGGS